MALAEFAHNDTTRGAFARAPIIIIWRPEWARRPDGRQVEVENGRK